MKILAFETATYFGGVAYVDGDIRESAGPFAPRESSREVLTAAHALLTKHDIQPCQLDLIAVSTGPGLFTGVRVGLSIAKTLAWSGKSGSSPALVAVPTLDAVASLVLESDSTAPGDNLVVVTDARRGEVYACAFSISQSSSAPSGRVLVRLGEDIVVRPNRLRERLPLKGDHSTRYWIVGDGYDRYEESIREQFPDAEVYPHNKGNLSFAVASLGREIFETTGSKSSNEVQPHYVRRPDARLPAKSFLSVGDDAS